MDRPFFPFPVNDSRPFDDPLRSQIERSCMDRDARINLLKKQELPLYRQ